MIAAPVPVGARLTDSLSAVDASHAVALKANGVDGCIRYLGSVTPGELAGIVDAGLGFMAVTFAERFDGAGAVAACRALGLPAGCTVWLDVEGRDAWQTEPARLEALINAWAAAVAGAGYMPGLYVGAPQPLTSAELYALQVVRYWHGQGRCVDRFSTPDKISLAEPECGWTMWQAYPSVTVAGVNVDVNLVTQDYRTRVPSWARATAAQDRPTLPDLGAV